MFLGWVTAFLSGGCTVFFLFLYLYNSGISDVILIPFAVGGIPFIIGIGIYWLGKWIYRTPEYHAPPYATYYDVDQDSGEDLP